jgi:hypothetical protein
LDVITQLAPKKVIAGHLLGNQPMTLQAVEFTRQYIGNFEAVAATSANAAELTTKMKQQYPAIGGDSILGLSAKVIMGEMKWGQ